MSDIVIHVVGYAGTDVERKVLESGRELSTFRLATTPRYWSKARKAYVDEPTNWLTVQCWRSLARNVESSLRRGQPVVVVGKLKTQEWVRDGTRHSRFVLDAIAVGHDLSRGIATFTKVAPVTEPYPDSREAAAQAAAEIEERTPDDLAQVIASVHDDAPLERFLADAS
jgi:single-strand DNA-binding protein